MNAESSPAPKRTRESTSKVRTGCSTCKARRVKCDETKPICRRCAFGRRTCEYSIAPAVASRRHLITVYLPPSRSQPSLFVNDRGLDFFQQNLASKLDGQFDSKFWSILVLQLSQAEPSVRHAVAAISVIYQDVEASLHHPNGYVKANPEAQQEWNTAVKRLSARIQAQPNSNLVPLVCCLLFTCIEFLRGNVDCSMLHIQSGLNILAALRGHIESVGYPKSLSFSELRSIEDHVVPVFSRLNVLCALAGRSTPPMNAHAAQANLPHEDLTDSRRRLYQITDACIQFIRTSGPKAAIFQIAIDDLVEQAKLQTSLDTWREQLNELLDQLRTAGISVKEDALYELLIHYKVIYIWLRVCTTAEETSTDSYQVDFQELVQYVEHIANPGNPKSQPQLMSFDMHITGPLYYTALKCRHSALRRRALELLRLAPRREGLWNAHHAYMTAKRIIELEESSINGQGLPDEASRLHGLCLPDDESRLYNVGELPFGFQKFDHDVVPSPAYPGTLEAVFQMKPWGVSGEWQTITEYIEL